VGVTVSCHSLATTALRHPVTAAAAAVAAAAAAE